MPGESYRVTIRTSSDDKDISIARAGKTLQEIEQLMNSHRLTSTITNVEWDGTNVSFDITYQCLDGAYFGVIEEKLEEHPLVKEAGQVHFSLK